MQAQCCLHPRMRQRSPLILARFSSVKIMNAFLGLGSLTVGAAAAVELEGSVATANLVRLAAGGLEALLLAAVVTVVAALSAGPAWHSTGSKG